MTALWVLGVVAGLALAIWASHRALNAAMTSGELLGMPPFIIGVTIVAVGTDLPEIATCLIATAFGHGDVAVGNSIGSVVTQSTLVLGILCITGEMRSSGRWVLTTGALTSLALLIGAVLFGDAHFSRSDGALLVAAWLVGTIIIQPPEAPPASDGNGPSLPRELALVTLFLLIVGAGAALAVESFTRAASDLGLPEYLLSFFAMALGTSLPELVVAAQAVRRGQGELAMGDIVGSSFVDATLAPGIGPLFFPVALSAGVDRGNLIAAVVIAIVTAILLRSPVYRWPTGVALLGLYAVLYPALIT